MLPLSLSLFCKAAEEGRRAASILLGGGDVLVVMMLFEPNHLPRILSRGRAEQLQFEPLCPDTMFELLRGNGLSLFPGILQHQNKNLF